MTYLEIQNAIKRRVRDARGNIGTVITDSINWTLLNLSSRHNWYFWRRNGYFATVAPYTTGTVTAVSDARTVTGVATVWNYQFKNRKMEFGSTSVQGTAQNVYKVWNVASTTSLVLQHPYRDTVTAGDTYVIYQDEYTLRRDVDRITMIRHLTGPRRVLRFFQDELYGYDANPRRTGDPEWYRPLGVTDRAYYSTGSASVSTTVTVGIGGTGASADSTWLGRFLRLNSESRVYEITSVPTATRVKLGEAYGGTQRASAFEIDPPGTPVLQIYPIPDSKQYIEYEYQKIPDLLYSDTDQPEVPEKWHEVLVLGAVWRVLQQLVDVNPQILQSAQAEYERFIEEHMKGNDTQEVDRIRQFGHFDYRFSRVDGPQLPSNYPPYQW